MAIIVVNLFHSEWASARGINGDIGHKTQTELEYFTLTTPPQTVRKNLEECTYQTAHQNDGFNALRLYCSKLDPACNAFFQFLLRFWKGPEKSVWFENRCLGINKLGCMMKELKNGFNTMVGCWFVKSSYHDSVRQQE